VGKGSKRGRKETNRPGNIGLLKEPILWRKVVEKSDQQDGEGKGREKGQTKPGKLKKKMILKQKKPSRTKQKGQKEPY